MPNSYIIQTELLFVPTSKAFELAEGKTWEDVQDWHVKWDTLHLTYDGETWEEIELDSEVADGADWKRPMRVEVHTADSDGYSNYDLIAER